MKEGFLETRMFRIFDRYAASIASAAVFSNNYSEALRARELYFDLLEENKVNEIISRDKTIRDFSSSLFSIQSQINYFNELFARYGDIPKPILFHYNQIFDLFQILNKIINTMQKHNFADGINECLKEYSRRMEAAGCPYAIWDKE